jgi:Holliday junction DNA helicase RuvA
VIAHLRGTVSSISAHAIVIDVSGVGYLAYSTSDQISNCRVGQEITLQTVQIFREDSVQLFGFSDLDQVGVFNLLCTVTGVGAKTALGVISQMGVYGIQEAVAKADSDASDLRLLNKLSSPLRAS